MAIDPAALSDLRKLIEEQNSYVRTNMQIWVQWFTFFITVNFVALGWFAGEIAKGNLKDRAAPQRISLIFLILNGLGVWVTQLEAGWFRSNRDQLGVLYGLLEKAGSTGIHAQFNLTGVHDFYCSALHIATAALITVAGAWILLCVWKPAVNSAAIAQTNETGNDATPAA